MRRFFKTFFTGFLLCFFAIVFTFSAGAVVLIYGPFEDARELWVTTAMTTYKSQFLATWFFSDTYIKDVMKRNADIEAGRESDPSLIHVGEDVPAVGDNGEEKGDDNTSVVHWESCGRNGFVAYMMIVRDPSLVRLGVTETLGERGQSLSDLVAEYGAFAGINAGGFYDPNGKGNGGTPMGVVMKDGKVLYDDRKGQTYSVVGFDTENRLVLGKFTVKQMKEHNLRDAVEFSPFLIVNGKKTQTGTSLHPRTAIGQRADGTVLMLIIDGRSLTSVGATLGDVIDIMEEYGAVNCANLDGGSSTTFIYDGALVNKTSTPMGQRYLPTAFLVMPPKS